MKIGAMDTLNYVVGILTLATTIMGLLSGLYAAAIILLIASWFAYHKVPWAHRSWITETIIDDTKTFYAFASLLHVFIVYSLAFLIVISLLVGFATKTGPGLISKDVAEHVWNNKWTTKVIEAKSIPPELQKIKREDQPYAFIIDSAAIKAAPLNQALTDIANRYSSVYVQLGAVLFFVVIVTGIVLYPTEMLAEARHNRGEE